MSAEYKINPAVDGEGNNMGGSLHKANKTKMLSCYLPPNLVQDARNARPETAIRDGSLLVIFMQ